MHLARLLLLASARCQVKHARRRVRASATALSADNEDRHKTISYWLIGLYRHVSSNYS